MSQDIYLVIAIIGFLLFLIMLFLFLKHRDIAANTLAVLEDLNEKYKELIIERDALKETNSSLNLRYAVLESRNEQNMKASHEKLEVLQNAKNELSSEFKLLANKIFEDKARQFSNSSKEQIELLLKPFREQITLFSKEAKEQFNAQSKDSYLLKDELLRLRELNAKLSQDAINLTNALKGENKTQGNWGEIVLESILEQSGLREGVEYELQATLKSDEGRLYRPDVIVHLPQNRDIIIDSKVSLVAYERFVSSDDLAEKESALKEHIKSIASHIKELSAKKYEKLQGLSTLDFVLLFMPIEGAFLLALEQDGTFFKNAYENNILVVSPSTLLVTLRTIEHIWRTQRQEAHAKKIADEAEAMYEKLVLFVDEMQKVGLYIQKAQEAHETSISRLKTGRGNIIKRAENIVKLGIKPKKYISIKSEKIV